jgi:predicted nucleic acid-binding protein
MVAVIDASVAIKFFVHETGSQEALKIWADLLEKPARFAVPELFFFELMHVFNRLIPDPSHNQLKVLNTLLDCGVARFAMTVALAARVRKLQKKGLSGYDAAYVALAQELSGTWLTCDAKAHCKVKELGVSRLLGEV